jgi:hypothetical protein
LVILTGMTNYLAKAVSLFASQYACADAVTEAINQINKGQKRKRRPVRQSHISTWLNAKSGNVPAEYAIPIELATNGKVTRKQLRPDIYPD